MGYMSQVEEILVIWRLRMTWSENWWWWHTLIQLFISNRQGIYLTCLQMGGPCFTLLGFIVFSGTRGTDS